MNYELYYSALERAVAEILGQFEDTPDDFLREVDLHAAFFHALQRYEVLTTCYTTRDGHRVGLVHREYPTLYSPDGLSAIAEGEPASYDIAILDPGFVRGHRLEVLAGSRPPRSGRPRRSPTGEQEPLLAACSLRLIEGFTPAVLHELAHDARDLTRSGHKVRRCYLVIGCRHWDLDHEIRKALKTIQGWADSYPHLSIVVAQSYRDAIGHVFAARYLNMWGTMAPLLPLDSSPRPTSSRVRGKLFPQTSKV